MDNTLWRLTSEPGLHQAVQYRYQTALLKVGTPFRFDIVYTNTGREPALNVNTNLGGGLTVALPPRWQDGNWIDFKVGQNDSCGGAEPIIGGPTVYPTGLFTNYTIHLSVNTLDTIGQIIKPEVVLVYKGCILYETMRTIHKSAYCFYLQPMDMVPPERWTFRTCGEGNYAN